MIQAIATIARTTFKETIRDRILLVLAVFTLLLLGTSIFLGTISLDQDSKIIIDFGLFGIFFFGVIITLFLGGSTIVRELDQRTAYTTLARPISRSWFVLGKFFGLIATLFVLTLLMSLVFCSLVAWRVGFHSINASLIISLFYLFLEFCVLTSLVLLFSSFSSSIMSTIYGFAFFLIGHSTTTLVTLSRQFKSSARYLFIALYYIFPNLEKFNTRNDAVYGLHPNGGEVILTVAYAVLYCTILLFLANQIFRKTEL